MGGRFQVATEPTQLEIKTMVENIDASAGLLVSDEGKRFLPVMREELRVREMIHDLSMPLSYMGMTEDFIYVKQHSSANHWLINKAQKSVTQISTLHSAWQAAVPGMRGWSYTGRLGNMDTMIQVGSIIYYTINVSNLPKVVIIDTTNIRDRTHSYNPSDLMIDIPGFNGLTVVPRLIKTRAYVFLLAGTQLMNYFRTDSKLTTGIGASNNSTNTSVAGVSIGSYIMGSVHRIMDDGGADPDVIILVGQNDQNTIGYICRYNFRTKTVLAYTTISVTMAQHVGLTGVVYEDEDKFITADNNTVAVTDKKTLLTRAVTPKLSMGSAVLQHIDEESFTLFVPYAVEWNGTNNAGTVSRIQKFKREKFYFDSRPSEVLLPLQWDLEQANSPTSISAYSHPIHGYDKRDVYIGTTNQSQNGLYVAKYDYVIDSYKEVAE